MRKKETKYSTFEQKWFLDCEEDNFTWKKLSFTQTFLNWTYENRKTDEIAFHILLQNYKKSISYFLLYCLYSLYIQCTNPCSNFSLANAVLIPPLLSTPKIREFNLSGTFLKRREVTRKIYPTQILDCTVPESSE